LVQSSLRAEFEPTQTKILEGRSLKWIGDGREGMGTT